MSQDVVKSKKTIKAAIIVLFAFLILLTLFFCYEIFYPYLSQLFEMGISKPDIAKITGEIKDNEEGYIRGITDQMIQLTNEEREKAGLKPLKKNEKLLMVADYKVLEMSKLKYFDHTSPKYGKIANQFLQFGGIRLSIDTDIIGENLAKFEGYDKAAIKPAEIIEAWMNSPEHKENILKKEYDAIGISVYFAEGKICYAAQEFMRTQ